VTNSLKQILTFAKRKYVSSLFLKYFDQDNTFFSVKRNNNKHTITYKGKKNKIKTIYHKYEVIVYLFTIYAIYTLNWINNWQTH